MRLVGLAPSDADDAISKGQLEIALLAAGPAGGLTPTIVKTGPYTAAAGQLVLCDTTAGTFTVTLPAAPAAGAVIGVKRTDTAAHYLDITAPGGALIDGDSTVRLAGPRTAVRLVADTTGGWRVESTAVFDITGGGGGGGGSSSSKSTATGRALGTQPGGQSAFTWYTVPAIAQRGIASLIEVGADAPAGKFDLEIRGAAPAGTLWLQALAVTGGTYRNPTCWYAENDTPGDDALHLGIRNTGADPRTYTLAALRVERFA